MEKCGICGFEIEDEGANAHLVYDVLICEECYKTDGENYEGYVGDMIRKKYKKNKNRGMISYAERMDARMPQGV